ncbi:radical SAM family heme chaperone HemW [Thalassoroseus pseudoceratinae]|uniref:radical SAM family heme chaperone HemW n=1 Tax=Thalassoroseus pseudoceratinae TaxID=2713176 RepID=UPI00141E6DD6|nr:radical SAM family heme chaperone HemW [Thalassoroseus pseudoceratinae]
MPPQAAYLHVPFCVHRCGYCDFTVVAGRDDLIPAFLTAMERELSSLGEPQPVRTLFLGGGTPTHLPPNALRQFLAVATSWFPLMTDGEFSVEANPADLTNEKITLLADSGVNRVSLGAQSFDTGALSVLERDHSPGRIADVVRALQSAGITNVSLDLIFGVPGQSLDSWRDSLKQAIELEPKHISTYGLTIEKGTAFWNRVAKDQLQTLPDELERAMYAAAMDDLSAAGFEQYELSNFAKPGFVCRHNQTYWQGEPYYGFGPGAARYLNGTRETNHRSVSTWLRRIEAGESAVMDSETLSPRDRAHERLALGLRMMAGIDIDEFASSTGFTIEELAGLAIETHRANGFLEVHAGRLRLTREGRFVADTITVDML